MTIYFDEKGNKNASTIVFIHGGGVSGWMWGKQLNYFKDYHCLVPDLPEHGENVDGGYISIKESAKQIAELIEKHGNGGRANVVGHSLGAKITAELLSIRPELVTHAVIASALFRSIPLLKLFHRRYIYKLTTYMLKPRRIASWSVKQFKFPDKTYDDSCIREFQGLTADSLYRIYDELYRNLSIPDGLDKIDVPTLVVAGEKEPNAMRKSAADMVKIIPNAEGILMKKGLHTYPWVMHESFNKIVEAWINDKGIDDEAIIRLQNTSHK